MNNKKPNLVLESVGVIFKNFSGNPTKYTPAGKRTFNAIIPPEAVSNLIEQGWNVKSLKPLEEGDELVYTLAINVSYARIQPKVIMVTDSGHANLNEETVGLLDSSDIIYADLIISPVPYAMGGNSGITAYLTSGYFFVQEDVLVKKYGF